MCTESPKVTPLAGLRAATHGAVTDWPERRTLQGTFSLQLARPKRRAAAATPYNLGPDSHARARSGSPQRSARTTCGASTMPPLSLRPQDAPFTRTPSAHSSSSTQLLGKSSQVRPATAAPGYVPEIAARTRARSLALSTYRRAPFDRSRHESQRKQ